jgi:hypothetical protein
MKMNMKNRLAGVPTVVDHEPITASLEAPLLRDILRDQEQMPDLFLIYWFHAVNIRDMLFRNNKDMRRRLRIDILESDGMIILIHKLCRDRFLDDLAEDAILLPYHAISYLSKRRKKQLRSPV